LREDARENRVTSRILAGIWAMSEDSYHLINLHTANSTDAPDLRRMGAHPDYWYPVAWSEELKVGKTLGRRFAGLPIVLYRGKSGQAFALEDRCAHRQVPLHLGVVNGDELKCHYHGWSYNRAGKCVNVPYLGTDRMPTGVKSYPAREVDGLIFVFPGDATLAESRLPKALGSSQRKDYKTRQLNREVACHYTFMHENLFDMNHQFMHRNRWARSGPGVWAGNTAMTGRRWNTASAVPRGSNP